MDFYRHSLCTKFKKICFGRKTKWEQKKDRETDLKGSEQPHKKTNPSAASRVKITLQRPQYKNQRGEDFCN